MNLGGHPEIRTLRILQPVIIRRTHDRFSDHQGPLPWICRLIFAPAWRAARTRPTHPCGPPGRREDQPANPRQRSLVVGESVMSAANDDGLQNSERSDFGVTTEVHRSATIATTILRGPPLAFHHRINVQPNRYFT